MRIQKFVSSSLTFVGKHLPTILTIAGVGGVAGTAFLACKATLKTDQKLKEFEAENGRQPTKQEAFKIGIRHYSPAIFAGLCTGACIIGANRVSAKQLATVTAVASTAKKALDENRDKVKELFGDKGLRKVDEKINEDHAIQYFGSTGKIYETGHGSTLCCEGFLTGLLFRASREWIGKIVNEFNARIIAGEILSYNDFIEMLIPTIDPRILPAVGDQFGYNHEIRRALLEIVEDSFLLSDGSEPGLIFTLREAPLFEYSEQY